MISSILYFPVFYRRRTEVIEPVSRAYGGNTRGFFNNHKQMCSHLRNCYIFTEAIDKSRGHFFIELLMSLILKRYLQVEFRAKICCGNSRQETLVTLHIINL